MKLSYKTDPTEAQTAVKSGSKTREFPAERIEDIDVSDEMKTSFLEYSYSVIYSRALPDARDGLKPVQRRILYIMTEMGLDPAKGHVKSGRVVGDVMGKLHPHGDSSIYDALVRMAQPFAMRLPLVDGHGNFGSLDDGPAAYRYTEARLAPAAVAMTENLDEEVVEFVPNYDNQLMQPDVLPSAVPNLLVNGATGIAVGMATNMAPHNLNEVIDGAKHLLHNPNATTDDLMQFIPGPDLPGGGIIVGLDGIRDAYETGRGSFRTRAKVSVEKVSARRTGLVVTELPYLIGPERVIERIKVGVEAKRITGIADVTDLTDRKNGLRLVITLKTGYSPEAVLEQLYRLTPLEENFAINAVALVDGEPRTLGLKELLRVFLYHRLDVVTRRSRFRLGKRKNRLHLVEGLLIAILDIDEVIQLIRSSDDAETARKRLQQVFDLSKAQAEYILELRLRRLTKFSRVELETERDELLAEIAKLEEILRSKTKLREVVSAELDAAAATYGTPRRTVLTGAVARPSATKVAESLKVADSPATVMLSTTGRALRVGRDPENPTPLSGGRATKHGAVRSALNTTTRSEIGAVLSNGVVQRFTPVDLPEVPAASVAFSAGVSLTAYLGITDRRLSVVGLVALDSDEPVGLATRNGVVKRVLLTDLPSRPDFEIMTVKDDDAVIAAFPAPDASEFAFVASDAQLLRFAATTVRPQGRAAGGMAGMKLKAGAEVVFATAIPEESASSVQVVTVADSSETLPGADVATAKVSAWSEFPAKGRATGGVRSHRFLRGEDKLACAWVGTGTPRALAADGSALTLPTEESKRDASGAAINGAAASVGAQP